MGDSAMATDSIRAWERVHPVPLPSIADVADHFDYVRRLIGAEHVGFGSDFDGATIPREIGDAAGLPNLLDALRDSGYDDVALRKLAHENWVRVLRKTWGE